MGADVLFQHQYQTPTVFEFQLQGSFEGHFSRFKRKNLEAFAATLDLNRAGSVNNRQRISEPELAKLGAIGQRALQQVTVFPLNEHRLVYRDRQLENRQDRK